MRFNILSGHRLKLPFGCTVEFQNTIDPIIDAFLAHGNGYIPIEEIEFIEGDQEWEEMEIPHTVKVFSLFLTPDNKKQRNFISLLTKKPLKINREFYD